MTSIRFSFNGNEKINYLILEWDAADPSRPDPQAVSGIVTNILKSLENMPASIEIKPSAKIIPMNPKDEDDEMPTEAIMLPPFIRRE